MIRIWMVIWVNGLLHRAAEVGMRRLKEVEAGSDDHAEVVEYMASVSRLYRRLNRICGRTYIRTF